MRKLQILLVVLSVSMMVIGIFRGELTDIFRKATLICLECIGIG